MPFPCPGCGAPLDRSLETPLHRCSRCGGAVRSRPQEGSDTTAVYEVEIVGRPETRRRVEVAWDDAQRRRLRLWLAWSSLITAALVLALYALARLGGSRLP